MAINIKKYLLIILGSVIMGLSIALCIKTQQGSDALGVFYQGLAILLNISVGQSSLITSISMVLIVLMLQKSNLGIGTLIIAFFLQFGIDLGMKIILLGNNSALNYILLILGIITMSAGIALTIIGNLGKGPYDAMIFTFSNKYKLPYHKIKWLLDIFFGLTGFLMGGTFGLGPVVSILITGKCVTYFMGLFGRRELIS